MLRPVFNKGVLGALAPIVVAARLFAIQGSPDTTGKYLAGLAVPAATSSITTTGENPWLIHSQHLDRAWARTQQQQLPAIASWAPQFLGAAYQETGTMFYMFSGPDFLYAHAFFPNARTYILCGTEPVGNIPDLTAISPQVLPDTLANLRKSLESVLSWSFFITKEMKTDLNRTQLGGTLPLLYVFLARTGCTIESVGLVSLDRAGNVIDAGKGQTAGARITTINSAGVSQTVYYFCTDLSDEGIKSKPGFLRFCMSQGRGVSLVKAASYLMHESGFSQVRNFLLDRSDLIIQDDSGIPVRFFDGENWSVRYCGRYTGPIDIFRQHWQADLADAYARIVPSPLSFSFGYQWRPNRSDLIIAARIPNAPIEAQTAAINRGSGG